MLSVLSDLYLIHSAQSKPTLNARTIRLAERTSAKDRHARRLTSPERHQYKPNEAAEKRKGRGRVPAGFGSSVASPRVHSTNSGRLGHAP
eukprot:SAG31_NODE_22026_length_535_cov_1.162844_1_plen_89_part_01